MAEHDPTFIWTTKLKTVQQAFDAGVDVIASQIRDEVLLPLCRKHRVTYATGMGQWWFTRVDAQRRAEARRERVTYVEATHWNFHEEEEALKHGLDLGDVWKLLWIEVGYGDYVGYHIAEITEADWISEEPHASECSDGTADMPEVLRG